MEPPVEIMCAIFSQLSAVYLLMYQFGKDTLVSILISVVFRGTQLVKCYQQGNND